MFNIPGLIRKNLLKADERNSTSSSDARLKMTKLSSALFLNKNSDSVHVSSAAVILEAS